MGFRPQDTVRIVFENDDHPLHGLEMRTRMPTVQAILDSLDALENSAMLARLESATEQDLTPEYVEAMRNKVMQSFEVFLAHLIEWNLEDPSPPYAPVPMTVEGIKSVGRRTMGLILTEWRAATSGVDADLKDASSSGETSPMLDIPMEAQ